ncbi:MAG: response regulator transcription factor [Saprospiraceae bacterium]|nr:response regulator transcription factor [Saprospiraceae bacterium]
MMNVALLGDDIVLLEEISDILDNAEDVKIIHMGNNLQKFISGEYCNQTNVVILDYSKPLNEYKIIVDSLKNCNPDIKITMLLGIDNEKNWLEILSCGADSYIERNVDQNICVNYLRELNTSGNFISTKITGEILNYFKNHVISSEVYHLPVMCYNVLSFLSKGMKYEEIAENMEVSINVVRYYIKQIYKILEVDNKGGAISLFLKGNVKLKSKNSIH